MLNILFTLGYINGILLVWAGLESLTIEKHQFSLGIFIIGCGLAWWALLNIIGRWWSQRQLAKKTKG